jgi:hypothetical protein
MERAEGRSKKGGRPLGSKMVNQPLAVITGSNVASLVLIFLAINGRGYPSEIARILNLNISAVLSQLKKFESAGLLERTDIGSAAVFSFSRIGLGMMLKEFILKTIEGMAPDERTAFAARRKPRSSGKKLKFSRVSQEKI